MKQLKSICFGLLLVSGMALQAQNGAIKGQIKNDDHLPVFGATVKLLQGGSLVGGAVTDEEGKYTIKPLNAGSYEIFVSSMETQTKHVTGVKVSGEKTTYVDVAVSVNTLDGIDVIAYTPATIEKTYMNIKEINAEDFSRLAIPRGDITQAVLAVTSEAIESPDGEIHFRGGRGDASAYYVDGVRSPGITGVAALSVENVSVITGGIPAQYGDVTSGVIIVTTKDYFGGIQSARMRNGYITEHKERIQREKNAVAEEKKRKKEIEEELKKEEEEAKKKEK
jgi:hypothetical protein